MYYIKSSHLVSKNPWTNDIIDGISIVFATLRIYYV